MVRIEDCIPPETINVRTYVDFFAGNKDWETNNATVWFNSYLADAIEFKTNPDNVWVQNFFSALDTTGKDHFFAQYSFYFEIPDCDEVERCTTKAIDSNIVRVN